MTGLQDRRRGYGSDEVEIQIPGHLPVDEETLTIDRDAHPGGYWHIAFHEGKEAFE